MFSILNQSYKHIEVIVINDGSTDNTSKILGDISESDRRVKVINQENAGVSAARNTGLKQSSGKYILFVDSDDTLDFDLLTQAVNNIECFDCDMVIFGYKSIRQDKVIEKSHYDLTGYLNINKTKEFCNDNSLINPPFNKLYKKSIILENKIKFPIEIKIGEDAIFNREYFMKSKTLFISNDLFYNYLIHPNSAMRSLDDDYSDQIQNLKSKSEFMLFFNEEFNEDEFIIKNAYHKTNLIFKTYNKVTYKEYMNKLKNFKMIDVAKKNKISNLFKCSRSSKVKFLLLKVSYLDFVSKKITRFVTSKKKGVING